MLQVPGDLVAKAWKAAGMQHFERHLRVGLFRDDVLVDERWFSAGQNVSVGPLTSNTLIIPDPALPKSHLLLSFDGNTVVLHGMEGLSGELALNGEGRQSLADLRSKILAMGKNSAEGARPDLQKDDSARQNSGSESQRGKSEKLSADSGAQKADSERQSEDSESRSEDSESQSADSGGQISDSSPQSPNSESQSAASGALSADSESQIADLKSQSADSVSHSADSEPQDADSESQSADSVSQRADSESQDADLKSQSADSESQNADLESQSADWESQSANSESQSTDLESQREDSEAQRVDSASQSARSKSQNTDFGSLSTGLQSQSTDFESQSADPGPQNPDPASQSADDRLNAPSAASAGDGNGADWTIRLPASTRGWLSLGDWVIFLQIAPKPAPAPPPVLPPSMKTGGIASLEKSFLLILAAVLALEAMALVVVHRRPEVDPDGPVSMENLDRFAEIIMPDRPKEPPVAEPETESTATAEEGSKAEEQAEPQNEQEPKEELASDVQPDPAAEAQRRERLREEIRNTGLLQVIGATGGSGALANVFASSSGFSDDVGAALAGVSGVALDQGDAEPQRRGGGAEAETVGIGDLGAAAGGGRTATVARAKVVPPQISIDEDEFESDDASVSKESLSQFIRPRLRSVQQCYERELKRNPGLAGKLVVRFLITTAGRVGEVSIESDSMGDSNVNACIVSTIRRWVFPIKPEDEAAVTFPFVFSPGG